MDAVVAGNLHGELSTSTILPAGRCECSNAIAQLFIMGLGCPAVSSNGYSVHELAAGAKIMQPTATAYVASLFCITVGWQALG